MHPYKVKFTPYRKNIGEIMFRQTKDSKGLSADGRYQFFIDEDVKDVDFWVVQGKGLRVPTSCHVAPQNTVFLSTEPESILIYPENYLRQFGLVSTCQVKTKHPNIILDFPALPWYIGFEEDKEGKIKQNLTYNILRESNLPTKSKLISVITSNKAFTQGHIDRIKFVEKLKDYYGEQLDVFGRGFNSFDDKWEVLSPYKYHIAIENSEQEYYWTEKLSDAYLAGTFPFYIGCTNISNYIPNDSFAYLDIKDANRSIEIINQTINENAFEKNKNAIAYARNLMLEDYNLFNHIASLLDNLDPKLEKRNVTLYPCKTMSQPRNFFNYMIARPFFKYKHRILNIGNRKKLDNLL